MSAPATHPVIALWSHPRAMSTALLRVMMERGDLLAVYEPFSELAAVGRCTVGDATATSPAELLDVLLAEARARPVFFKDTTEYRHGALLDDRRLLQRVTHTFIVRDPLQAIPSHYAVNSAVTCAEIGYEHQHEIFAAVRQATGATPVVVDAADLREHPARTVEAYCAAVGLGFVPQALDWEPGGRPEWRRTAHWHREVDGSSGIEARSRRYEVRVDNDERLAAYERHHRPFYEELHRHRLRLPSATAPGTS